MLQLIRSGLQTGADRGAIDAAMHLEFPIGVCWVPHGFRSEDGAIPQRYRHFCQETESSDYLVRTRRNIVDSNGTVLFISGGMTPGTYATIKYCKAIDHRYILCDFSRDSFREAAQKILKWIQDRAISTLNVAGSRESLSPGIQEKTMLVMVEVMREVGQNNII